MRPRYYGNFTDYARPWFEPGPPLQDWRAPAPFVQVALPSPRVPSSEAVMSRRQLLSPRPGDPWANDPFIPHYYAPTWPGMSPAAVMYGRGKDATVRGSLARMPPSPMPALPGFQSMVPRYPHYAVSEAASAAFGWDDDDDLGLDDDDLLGFDDDDFGYDFDDLGAEDKKRPFAAISKLFRKAPGSNKTRAEEALVTVKRLEREAAKFSPPALPSSPPAGITVTPTQIAVGAVGTLAVLGLGFGLWKWSQG